jgi:hypothetical protein
MIVGDPILGLQHWPEVMSHGLLACLRILCSEQNLLGGILKEDGGTFVGSTLPVVLGQRPHARVPPLCTIHMVSSCRRYGTQSCLSKDTG